MLAVIWFWLVAFMIAMYVVLDGFDLGAGIIHLGVARTEDERRTVIKSIGPVWDGNEVWLVAGGGTLYFAFPALYASSFSGFYLPLMIVLWLLILRGLSIEFRNHIEHPVWKPLWDTIFMGASALLAIFFGAALGNVVRGVPLTDGSGDFFLPLWTDFQPGPNPGILDWYTILVGLLAFLTLTQHGALWVNLKTGGEMQQRSVRIARAAWYGVAVLTPAATIASFAIQPRLARSFQESPGGAVFPVLAIAGLAGAFFYPKRDELRAFLASCVFILGLLTSAVFGLFPYVLPSVTDPAASLTVHNAAAPESGLRIGLIWFLPALALTTAYFTFLYRRFSGKVQLEESGH